MVENKNFEVPFAFVILAVAFAGAPAIAQEAEEAAEAAEGAEGTSEETEAAGAEEAGAAEAELAEAEVPPEPVREARERVNRGEELFEQGNYDAALVEFQQAYDVIGDHPRRYLILYNIGQCHERSFRYDQALRFYHEYLEEGGEDAEGREAVLESIESLERLLATVRVEVNLPRAEVWVDERAVGTAPGTIRIPGGVHTVQVRAEGHLPVQHEVSIPAGGERTLEFTLERLPERFRGLHPTYFWTSLGLTVVSLGIGIGVGVSAFQAHNEVDRRLGDETERWDVTQQDIDQIGDRALAADLLFGAAALFAVGTVIFGVLTNWDDDEASGAEASRRPRLSIAATARSGNLSLDWTF